MADTIPPIPYDQPQTSFEWVDWYEKLRKTINASEIQHNSLAGIQGGTTTERYHLTLAEKTSITGLSETIDDRVAALLVAGNNVTITYNDAANTLTIAVSQAVVNTAGTLTTTTTVTNGAAAAVGTLNNAPVAGNPTKWLRFNDNGTIRFIPSW